MPFNFNTLKIIIVSKFKSFCKHSTLHGVYYFYKSSRWTIHLLWVMILGFSIALCGFLGHMIWQKFVIDPTLTVVETTHYSMANVPFPAVTICDTESVYLPNTREITDILQLRGYNQSEIREFYRSFSGVRNRDYAPKPFVKKIHLLLEDIGYPFHVLLDLFKRPCNDMIVECAWRSRPHNCSEMFRSVFTVVGYCCRFDTEYFRRQADVQTNIVSGMDATEAMEIVVSRQEKSIDDDNFFVYAAMYLYDYKDKVTFIDSAISLTPQSYFDVNLLVWAIDSSSYVKALPLSARRCTLETDTGAGAVFYQECMSRLILKTVVNQCKCLPFNYTAEELDVDEYSACTWERLLCIYQTTKIVQVGIKDIIDTSECYQRCDYVEYQAEVDFITNRRHLSVANQNRSQVQIHYGQTTCMKYRREVLYTWDQMLANLGGIFGLCLGGSVISVIELVWFIFELLFAIIGSLFTKPTVKDDEKNKVFVLSQKYMNSKKLSDKKLVGKYKFVN